MSAGTDRPNLLVIMTDQHAKRVTGCYGNEVVSTPAIDRLAADGLVFDDAYCPAPLCVPSRMSFLTGRLPSRNRVVDNGHMLSSTIPTFAHALGAVGYETALMGKMHFVGPDHRHGFELRSLGEFLARYPGVPELGGPRWTRFSSGTSGQERVSVDTVGTGTTTYQWFDRLVANTAVGYLERARESRRRTGRPFAAVVGFNLPHCPFVAPKELFERYLPVVPMPDFPGDDEALPATVRRYRERRGIVDPPVPPEQLRRVRAAYYALVTHVDSLVGEVLDALDRSGLTEETIVVYCADHGEMAGEHGSFWKSIYYEDAASVPLVLRAPSMGRRGERSRAVVNLYDLAVTLCDAAGAELPFADGRSFLPVLDDLAAEPHFTTTFSELYDPKGGGAPLLSRMVRSGDLKLWKFYDAQTLPPTLFDLASDPEERNDLGLDAHHASDRMRLEALLEEGWDPVAVEAAAREEGEHRKLFAAYGSRVRPAVDETLAVPPPWVEGNVEILE